MAVTTHNTEGKSAMRQEDADQLVADWVVTIGAWIQERPNVIDGEWNADNGFVGVLKIESNDGTHPNAAARDNEVYVDGMLQPDFIDRYSREDLDLIKTTLAKRFLIEMGIAAKTTPTLPWEV